MFAYCVYTYYTFRFLEYDISVYHIQSDGVINAVVFCGGGSRRLNQLFFSSHQKIGGGKYLSIARVTGMWLGHLLLHQ
jgi:hypothetical protein